MAELPLGTVAGAAESHAGELVDLAPLPTTTEQPRGSSDGQRRQLPEVDLS